MSFSDPPPPQQPQPAPPFMIPPYAGGDVNGFWQQQLPMMNHEFVDSHMQFEQMNPFKRPRIFENDQHNGVPFSSMNSRMNPPNLPGNKGTTHIFYKTRMCAKFMEGTCRNGDQCTFAHGPDDLREPPPNWQEIIREKDRGVGNWNEDQRIIHRMKICKKFYNGEECPYGEKCNFLHERPSKFKTDLARQRDRPERESSAISIGTIDSSMGSRSNTEQFEVNKQVNGNSDAFRVKPVYWKTKLCSKWEIGQCPFGEKCHFAHGESELQMLGGRVEIEAVANSGSFQTKHPSVPLVDSSPATLVLGAPIKSAEEKKLSKWKLTNKINRIYGDWIEDLSPPHEMASKAEV